MKRKRNSTQKASKEAEQVFDANPQKTSPSITDLPKPIFIDILLRLPVKRIIMCKSVCKTWYTLVTDPEFAKLHFARAEVCTLVRTLDSTRVSRMLYLVEPGSFHDVDLGYCISDPFAKCDCRKTKLAKCKCRKTKLDAGLKLPLRSLEMMLNHENDGAKMRLPKYGSVKSKRCVKLRPKDHKFKIVNSCNGFLCLSEPSRNEPLVVCNPITGEYINLPVAKSAKEGDTRYIDCGFGFSPKSKQYKVIRIFDTIEGQGSSRGAVVHTLGTGLWKTIDKAPWSLYKLAFPTYLNGCLYWLRYKTERSNIVSFDFDNEQFQSVPPPPLDYCGNFLLDSPSSICMGVLSGCLCIFDHHWYEKIDIWVMNQSVGQQSWTKKFYIHADSEWWHCGLYQPINYLKNGALFMFHYPESAFICWGPTIHERECLKIHGVKSKFEAIAYIPSFISLKDAVMGDNVVVLNIKESCAEFKLHGETKAVFMREASKERVLYSDCSIYDDDKWKKHWWEKWCSQKVGF